MSRQEQSRTASPPPMGLLQAPSIVKCHDRYCARGCHIGSLGLSDSSPSNTAALWFLSDKCGSLRLTKMNVLVYGSRLSAILREPVGLDPKPGVHWVASTTFPLSHRLSKGGAPRPSICVCVCAKTLQSCPTLYHPMDRSWPGSYVHGIFQTRILGWVAMPSSRGSS